MANLEARGLPRILYREVIERRKPFLGICLGLQLLAKASAEHGRHAGLGWIDGEVTKFEPTGGRKVPHIGWNDVHRQSPHPLFAGLHTDQFCFYFVHSFHLLCRDTTDVVATCEYGIPFTAAIARANIAAMQFHPEKSQDNGVQVLKNFATWKP
jgi:glutamine amidotransferase